MLMFLTVSVADAQPARTLPQSDIDRLVARIALYPDVVLTDVLAASTYPAQVVEADRFAADPANAGLTGAALTDAAAAHDWDPSVVALLQFPAVLHMMDTDLEWTEQLGNAFMAQQADVLDAVQRLRQQAEQNGTLKSGWQESVVNDGDAIAIDPPSSQYVYLPVYAGNCFPGGGSDCADGLTWDSGTYLPYGIWVWAVLDWPHRQICYDRGAWEHDRHGARLASLPRGATGSDVWRHVGPVHAALHAAPPAPYHYAPPATEAFGHAVEHVRLAPRAQAATPLAVHPSPAVARPAIRSVPSGRTGAVIPRG
jgi:hypothetical protein